MNKFNYIVIFTALLLASCAAFFSVYGIGLLFSGALIATVIMASSIELGKIVSVTWLFNNWSNCNKLIRAYLITAISILMIITSLGIFGYLMAAHQKSALETELSTNKISLLEEQQKTEAINRDTSQKNIERYLELRKLQEDRLSTSLTNVAISRNPIQLQSIHEQIDQQITSINKQIEDENIKIKTHADKINSINNDIYTLKITNADKKDITTFKFVADEFNTDIKHVVKWFILLIIIVFDPLAVVLILAFNISIKKVYKDGNKSENIINNTNSVTESVIEPVEIVTNNIDDTDLKKNSV